MYAVLHIPRFALQAGLRFRQPSSGDISGLQVESDRLEDEDDRSERGSVKEVFARARRPVALVDPDATKPVVLDMTRAAEREGVVAGLSVPQALARCQELEVLYRSAQAEAAARSILFHCAYSLSPRVEMQEGGLCLVDLSGVKLEAAEQRCMAIVEELKSMELVCRIGIAATSSVALLAAKRAKGVLLVSGGAELADSRVAEARTEYGEQALAAGPGERRVEQGAVSVLPHGDFLADLPIGAAEPGERLAEILGKWGIRTVGAFAALKRSAVGARLGTEGLELWDRVNGKEERVVAVTKLSEVFEESWQFEYEVDTLEPLLFLLRRFLDQLCLRLRMTGKVANFVSFELRVAYGEPIKLEMKVPEPTFDVEALFRLVAGRLETIESESPITVFGLRIAPIDFKQRQLGLFESSLKNPHRFAQTLARVAGIVGAERAGRPVLEADGRPDGVRLEELPAEVEALDERVSLDRCYGFSLRRFRPAQPANVELQGRQPVWFKSEAAAGFVKACRGPWLHSGHWWETERSWNRVEWDIELNRGGVYRLVRDDGKWFLEGVYD